MRTAIVLGVFAYIVVNASSPTPAFPTPLSFLFGLALICAVVEDCRRAFGSKIKITFSSQSPDEPKEV